VSRPYARLFNDRVEAIVDIVKIVAQPAFHVVGARHPNQRIVAAVADQDVIAAITLQAIRVLPPVSRSAPSPPDVRLEIRP
jgi:hypothetical protein